MKTNEFLMATNEKVLYMVATTEGISFFNNRADAEKEREYFDGKVFLVAAEN